MNQLRSLIWFAIPALSLMLASCAPIKQQGQTIGNAQTGDFEFSETEYDFGVIKQSGGKVSREFKFTYKGTVPVKITGVPTSCACTSAVIDKALLEPGESGILTVTFNPNLHGEPDGKFYKTAAILTEPEQEKLPEVKIWAEIDMDLGKSAFELKEEHEEEKDEDDLNSYESILPDSFAEMLKNKDFVLVDVHIPEQEHIEGTDLIIPYNEIEQRLAELPQDKNSKIVLYCRSGGMSRAAAYVLAENGYTNVIDLSGGKDAYDEFISSQEPEISGEANASYISVEAIVVSKGNISSLREEYGDIPESFVSDNATTIMLILDNHQLDLSSFDYESMAELNGEKAKEWLLLSGEMGGHHASGLLTFSKQENPLKLSIAGLPVGALTVKLTRTE